MVIIEEIHVLELPKVSKEPDESAVWDWAKFIGVESEEELNMLAEKNEVMGKAVGELYRVSADKEVRWQYEQRLKAWRDEQARTAYALQTGEAKGRVEGRVELLSLLKSGNSPEELLKMYDTNTTERAG
jgi:hypothetical protein